MRLKVLNEDATDGARALRDYVYEEAEKAGSNHTQKFGRPLTEEDRYEAYSEYLNSDSFMTWWENVISKRAKEITAYGVDAKNLFEGGEFDLNEAAKSGFYSGFGE
jgi:hypothetical protein